MLGMDQVRSAYGRVDIMKKIDRVIVNDYHLYLPHCEGNIASDVDIITK